MVAYHRKKATAVLSILCTYAKITDGWLIFIERYYFSDAVKNSAEPKKIRTQQKENTP